MCPNKVVIFSIIMLLYRGLLYFFLDFSVKMPSAATAHFIPRYAQAKRINVRGHELYCYIIFLWDIHCTLIYHAYYIV